MRQYKTYLFTVIITLSAFSAILYSSCQKSPTCTTVCLNGSHCEDGVCRCLSGYYGLQCQYTKIIYVNNTFTTVSITLGAKYGSFYPTTHDTVIYLKPNSTAEYFGIPNIPGDTSHTRHGDTAIASIYTFGPFGPSALGSLHDVVFGETVKWDTIKTAFMSNGTVNVNISVRPDYFFLQVQNNNPPPIGSLNVVNITANPAYTGANDTITNTKGRVPLFVNGTFTVINDSFTHNVGYFGSAWASSVVITDATGNSVTQSCGLPFSWNQSYFAVVP